MLLMIALVLSISWVLMIALISIAWVLMIAIILKYSMDVNDSISFKYSMGT